MERRTMRLMPPKCDGRRPTLHSDDDPHHPRHWRTRRGRVADLPWSHRRGGCLCLRSRHHSRCLPRLLVRRACVYGHRGRSSARQLHREGEPTRPRFPRRECQLHGRVHRTRQRHRRPDVRALLARGKGPRLSCDAVQYRVQHQCRCRGPVEETPLRDRRHVARCLPSRNSCYVGCAR